MNALICLKKATLALTVLVLTGFVFSTTAQAQLPPPPPDGGYPGGNTAEGFSALFSVTTGIDNTAIGDSALFSNTTGNGNTATGFDALANNSTGAFNTATGDTTLQSNTSGNSNVAIGDSALLSNTTGDANTANGAGALLNSTTGNNNTATGTSALFGNTTGNNNIALGNASGINLTTGSNNIEIGNRGVAAESNTIRIGMPGTQTATFIAGISGAGVMGGAVKVNAAGQLGTAPSSQRFKEEIRPMDTASEAILGLKPVAFRYKKDLDPDRTVQFGLVAEDVEKVNRDLVFRDAAGKAYSVRYEAVNAMLLNEFLKEHRTVVELKKEVAALTATVKAQGSQIQKVREQIEISKVTTNAVVNNE